MGNLATLSFDLYSSLTRFNAVELLPSCATIPAMAGLAVALTGTFANQYLVNRAQKEKDLLVDYLVAE